MLREHTSLPQSAGGGYWRGLFGTSGKRIYAAILVVFAAFLAVQLNLAFWLIESTGHRSTLLVCALAITALTGIAGALQVSQLLVFAVVVLARKGRPLSQAPRVASDLELPPVFVQIPGRNEPLELVRESIESVRALNYPREKILIQHVDNSDDHRYQLVAELYADEPRLSVIHRDGVRGFKAGNLNIGFERGPEWIKASPDALVVVLNVGDTLAPESLRLMASEFVADERVGFVQSLMVVANPGESIITKVESYVTNAMVRFLIGCQHIYGMTMTNGSAVAVRAWALIEAGGWDELTLGEDWSTGMKIVLRGWRPRWVDYAPNDPRIVCGEASPHTLEGQQKQKHRWATSSSQLARLYLRE